MSVQNAVDQFDRDGWELQHSSDSIAEWLFDIPATKDDVDIHNSFDKFVLTVQDFGDHVQVSIGVVPHEGVGDLLSSNYYQECPSIETAIEQGASFCHQVEEKYVAE